MNENLLYSYEKSEIEGVITFKNKNTTIGFIRFNSKGEVEYIFVNPAFRKKGFAKKLLKLTKEKIKKDLIPKEPISPLGKKLFNIV
ncbi:GNAT family N-acetyltransferase [Candidatus Pelagibacter bacterium]|mgnify:FL=1|jgi:predicted GNAT family acetyltransferase|nr:GNAT family N-acetyltransferase [Candidatus Pelagibacter bacterium]